MEVKLERQPAAFSPGELIEGKVKWSDLPISDSNTVIEIRLVWYTDGKGTRDVEIVSVEPIKNVSDIGEQDFRFTAPHRPSSFSGVLISLTWAVEIVALDSKASSRETLVIAPMGSEIVLSEVESTFSKKKKFFEFNHQR